MYVSRVVQSASTGSGPSVNWHQQRVRYPSRRGVCTAPPASLRRANKSCLLHFHFLPRLPSLRFLALSDPDRAAGPPPNQRLCSILCLGRLCSRGIRPMFLTLSVLTYVPRQHRRAAAAGRRPIERRPRVGEQRNSGQCPSIQMMLAGIKRQDRR